MIPFWEWAISFNSWINLGVTLRISHENTYALILKMILYWSLEILSEILYIYTWTK